MIEIKDLLGRWGAIIFSEEGRIESVRRIILEAAGIDIKKEEIRIKNGTLYLDVKPIYKNEILLKREKILSKLEDEFGKKTPKNIR